MAYTALVTNGVAAAPPHNSLGTNAGLVVVHGPAGLAASYPFRSTKVCVGRDPRTDVCLDGANSVSRLHAELEYRAGAWVLCDLGSRNGTFVDGVRVAEAPLDPSAIVRVGDCLFKFVAVGVESYARYTLDGERIASGVWRADDVQTPEALPPDLSSGGYRMDQVYRVLRRLAAGRVGVVLSGERGAEKERCAGLLHAWRGRRGAFRRIDCAGCTSPALARALLGSDVDAGTLLLDDADELSTDCVAELERVFDGRARIAGPSDGPLDVDVIVGLEDSERPAAALALPGPAYVIAIPPLRERKEALRANVLQILRDLGRPEVAPGFGFMLGLAHHDFPDDVKELREIIAHGLAACPHSPLDVAHLPEALQARIAALYGS
jgi:hypothetical protein